MLKMLVTVNLIITINVMKSYLRDFGLKLIIETEIVNFNTIKNIVMMLNCTKGSLL